MNIPDKRVLPPNHNSSLKEKAYHYVKEHLISRKYHPGQFISDKAIAEELNISRTPVRSALCLLEHEGLISNEGRKGWKVFSITLGDIKHIFEIKITLEGMLARKAAENITKKDKQELYAAFSLMKISAQKNDYESWLKGDIQFHHILYACADNPRAYRIVKGLNDQWNRVWVGLIAMEGRMTKSIGEHQLIYEAIDVGNGCDAEKNMRCHLKTLQVEVEQILQEIIFPFTDNEV